MGYPNINQGLSAPFGELKGVGIINKFGRASNVDQVPTDIWDRADTTSNQAIWIAPTAARVHDIVSTSIADTATAGAGARTIIVRGLVDWTTPEVSEGQTIHLSSYYASILRANLSTSEVHADLSLLAWLNPPVNPEAYILARTIGFGSRGSNPFSQVENPYFSCPGPCVVKMQAIGSIANLDISAGFSGYIDHSI